MFYGKTLCGLDSLDILLFFAFALHLEGEGNPQEPCQGTETQRKEGGA